MADAVCLGVAEDMQDGVVVTVDKDVIDPSAIDEQAAGLQDVRQI